MMPSALLKGCVCLCVCTCAWADGAPAFGAPMGGGCHRTSWDVPGWSSPDVQLRRLTHEDLTWSPGGHLLLSAPPLSAGPFLCFPWSNSLDLSCSPAVPSHAVLALISRCSKGHGHWAPGTSALGTVWDYFSSSGFGSIRSSVWAVMRGVIIRVALSELHGSGTTQTLLKAAPVPGGLCVLGTMDELFSAWGRGLGIPRCSFLSPLWPCLREEKWSRVSGRREPHLQAWQHSSTLLGHWRGRVH